MIAAISLMRRPDDITLTAFRRHWLDVHGPLVCAFPALRHYTQHHVIASPAMNERARQMRIDGFPILWFDSDEDRRRAHHSPQMAACNVDSRAFIGAVSRVICEPHSVTPQRANAGRIRLIALFPGERADDAALDRFADWACELPRLAGLTLFRVLQQGAAPNSTIPHLAVSAAGAAELAFPSLVDLECALAGAETDAAHFVVEEHRLV
ncbi:MAG TPA: EthD family reductase [Acetobacteraceae bacterium]|nr:EthD family reductase [Acetobacteraceae bacterium]